MIDEYWAAVYDRLQNDYEFLKLICNDTGNSDLFAWIVPNKILQARCGRFIRKGKIVNKNGVINEIIRYIPNEPALRKIILFNWIENNHLTMKFLDLNIDKAVADDLYNGKFGNLKKIEILSKIDPRNGAAEIYKKYFESYEKESAAENIESEESVVANTVAVNKVDDVREKQLEIALDTVKKDNKELKEALEYRVREVSKLSAKLAEQAKYINDWQEKSERLRAEIKELNARLDFETRLAAEKMDDFDVDQTSTINDLRVYSDDLKREAAGLKQALTNREASIARLERENEELKSSLKSEKNSNDTIANLQAKLAVYEEENESVLMAGQLVSEQLFVSVHREPITLSARFTQKSSLIFDEYALLHLNRDNVPVKIESLEANLRKELIGTIKSEQGSFFLETEYERFPVLVPISAKFIGRPARGIFLPEAENRDEGIYRVDALEASMNKNIALPKRIKTSKNIDSKEAIKEFKFNGEKILIVGGDRVGHEYENVLSSYKLDVVWRSGFESIKDLRAGLSAYDAVAIIVKQLSHTLLRELILAAEKSGVQIIYCKRRGISGVLESLKETFLPK